MRLRAGELDQRITLSCISTAKDPVFSQPTNKPVELGTFWAKRDCRGASEVVENRQVNDVSRERFYMRYREGLMSASKLRWRGVDYKVVAVSEVRTRETLMIDCEVRDGRS